MSLRETYRVPSSCLHSLTPIPNTQLGKAHLIAGSRGTERTAAWPSHTALVPSESKTKVSSSPPVVLARVGCSEILQGRQIQPERRQKRRMRKPSDFKSLPDTLRTLRGLSLVPAEL